MATAKKKTSEKRKAKTASKPARRQTRNHAAKKRAKRQARAKKAPRNQRRKTIKKAARKSATAKKTSKKRHKKATVEQAPLEAGEATVVTTSPPVSPRPKAVRQAENRDKPAVRTPHQSRIPNETPAAQIRSSTKTPIYSRPPIAYPNGVPHIGHAYEAIVTDAMARFQRLDGKDVFFLTGTDEHGLKMHADRVAEVFRPLELADRNAARFRDMDERLNVSLTLHPHHRRAASSLQPGALAAMAKNGDIYLDNYAGWYSVRDEAYYAEDETVVGEDKVRRGAARHAGRMGRRGKLFLQTLGLSGQAARAV